MDMMQFALNMIEKNPNVGNNPMARQMIEVLKSNDAKKGEEIANNLLNTYGVSREDAISQAKKFFGI